MFENKLSVPKTCQRKVTLLSEYISLLREKKVFYFEILAPGTIKENTRDCYFLMDIRIGEKVELCFKKDMSRIQHCLFYLNPAGMVHRIMTFFLFKSRDSTGIHRQNQAL
ncbi:TPA: hypothetical protein HA338_02835 [Methanosarcina acetivorans]|uniref:Uncharacterized protein n=2 Tax=Methanosarcina acetivorans TaxID=2214 RepID=Q8TQ88_METAC|nr:hypothetical protein [Methanosarcina acetivorans]AAM05071.1 predicted protein [Methanosarcina acetivorans C2A]HIH93003.1 hypothetical protein [Methanosarcina acetivorans]